MISLRFDRNGLLLIELLLPGEMMTRRSIWLNGKNFLMMIVLGNLNQRLRHFNLKLNNLIEFSLGLPKYLLESRRARFEMLLNLKTRNKSFNTMKIVLSFFLEDHCIHISLKG